MDNKEIKSFELNIKEEGDDKGAVEAVFSVFGNVDSDGDVVVPGAVKSGFKDTQVPMVFAHKWDQPIGKGSIIQDDEKAVFKGSFFMETEAGKEAYNLVKSMGDLQQWSFGFRVDDSEVAPFKKSDEPGDEYDVRYLKELTVYEVSPVLVGANQETYTLAIKSGEDTIYEKTEEKYGSCNHEQDGSCYKESKKELKSDPEDEECCGGDNCGEKGSDEEVSNENESSVSGRRFSEEVKDVLVALDDLVERAKAIGSLRSQDGRKLSEKATEALRAVQEDLNEAWNEIDEVIVEVGTITEAEEETPDTEEEVEVAETEEEVEAPEEVVEESAEVETPEVSEDEVVVEEEAPSEEEVTEVETEVEEEESSEEEVVEDEENDEIDEVILEAQHIVTESLIAETELDEI